MDTDDFLIFGNDDVEVSEDMFQSLYNSADIDDLNDPDFAGLLNMSSSNQHQQVSSAQRNHHNHNINNLRQEPHHIQQLQPLQSQHSSNQSNNNNNNNNLSLQPQGMSSFTQNFFGDNDESNMDIDALNNINVKLTAEEQKKTMADKKRQDRNAREQQRSLRISRQIDALRKLLKESGVNVKNSKYSVLEGVASYLTSLQEKVESYGEGGEDVILNQDQIYPGTFNSNSNFGVNMNMNMDNPIDFTNLHNNNYVNMNINHSHSSSSNTNGVKGQLPPPSSSSSSKNDGFSNSTYRSVLMHLPIPLALLLMDGSMILHNDSMGRIMRCAPASFGDNERHAIQSVYDMTPVDRRDELRQKLINLVGNSASASAYTETVGMRKRGITDNQGKTGLGVDESKATASSLSSSSPLESNIINNNNNNNNSAHSNVASNIKSRTRSSNGCRSKITVVNVDYCKDKDVFVHGDNSSSSSSSNKQGMSNKITDKHQTQIKQQQLQHQQQQLPEYKRISTRSDKGKDIDTSTFAFTNTSIPTSTTAIVSNPTTSDDLNETLNYAKASMNQNMNPISATTTNTGVGHINIGHVNASRTGDASDGAHVSHEQQKKRNQEQSEVQHFYHPSVYYWEGEQLFLAVSAVDGNDKRVGGKNNVDMKYLNLALIHEYECI